MGTNDPTPIIRLYRDTVSIQRVENAENHTNYAIKFFTSKDINNPVAHWKEITVPIDLILVEGENEEHYRVLNAEWSDPIHGHITFYCTKTDLLHNPHQGIPVIDPCNLIYTIAHKNMIALIVGYNDQIKNDIELGEKYLGRYRQVSYCGKIYRQIQRDKSLIRLIQTISHDGTGYIYTPYTIALIATCINPYSETEYAELIDIIKSTANKTPR